MTRIIVIIAMLVGIVLALPLYGSTTPCLASIADDHAGLVCQLGARIYLRSLVQ